MPDHGTVERRSLRYHGAIAERMARELVERVVLEQRLPGMPLDARQRELVAQRIAGDFAARS